MSGNSYFTAYDKNGELIKYQTLNEVPADKQFGALVEKDYREEGLHDFAERFNKLRREEAMKEQ